mmetsp:Transcript_14667/g.27113  ORF Transcript_14667/g.27113 Transcript_14667/m.27113 type:complete len:234 (-) Transcript_14667:131-832(-)
MEVCKREITKLLYHVLGVIGRSVHSDSNNLLKQPPLCWIVDLVWLPSLQACFHPSGEIGVSSIHVKPCTNAIQEACVDGICILGQRCNGCYSWASGIGVRHRQSLLQNALFGVPTCHELLGFLYNRLNDALHQFQEVESPWGLSALSRLLILFTGFTPQACNLISNGLDCLRELRWIATIHFLLELVAYLGKLRAQHVLECRRATKVEQLFLCGNLQELKSRFVTLELLLWLM